MIWPALLIVAVVALGTFAADRVSDPAASNAAVLAPARSTSSTSTATTTVTAPPTTQPAAATTQPAAATTTAFDVGSILEGSEWELDAWVSGDDAEAVPRGVRDSTIEFVDGVATLDTSCNTGSVDYSITADQVTFESLVLTELACDRLAHGVEQAIVDTLDGTTTVSFAAGVLFIDRDDRRLVYLAERRD